MQMTANHTTLALLALVPVSYVANAAIANRSLSPSETFVTIGFAVSALAYWLVRIRKKKI
jgi:LPXTG-motif cell wall-anchored protein